MKAGNRPRFDIDALRALAGDKVFARAEAYFRAGQVEILSLEPNRVLAQVAGTEDYRTVITGGRAEIGGECSCPAFGKWGFCKHMAAAALAANEAGDDDAEDGGGALARIRDHLETKSVDVLAGMIVTLAERDPALFRRLDMAAATLQTDGKTLETRLRKSLDSTLRTRGFIDYYRATAWAAGVAEALDALADLIPDGHAGLVLGLAEHAIVRIGEAVENIDDSDGHCMSLLNRAQEIHLAACRVAPPDPMALARDLFSREMEDEYDIFHRAVAHYADVLGEDGLAEYRRLAIAGWEKLPPRTGDGGARYEYSSGYGRLASILDFFADRGGDVEARIALRAKDLSSPWKYLQLAEFCLSKDRKDQALQYAEEGLWVFEDARPDERLVFMAADLMLGAGRKEDAKTLLWSAFEREPSLDLYRRLRKLGGKDAIEPAVAFLRTQISKDTATKWHSPADLLIRILMEEKMFDAAWAAVQDHGASGGLKESLARASEATHPGEALAVYGGRVDELVKAGGNPGYESAFGLVTRMGELRGASAQAAYVADLKTRFRRKRNFMKLLG
ncbi:MAG: SWIM zinc finger family protein [Alphaproteobacteria bacterium]